MDPFNVVLKRVRNRLLLLKWIAFVTRSLLWGGIVACGWLVLTRLFPIVGPAEWPAAVILGVAVVVATGWSVWKRPSTVRAALEADQRLGLRERLTSSLEFDGVDAPMVDELHADARAHVERINVSRDFPIQPPRLLRWVAAPAVAFLVMYVVMPEWDLLGHRERVAEARAKTQDTQVKVERLRAVAKPLREMPGEELSTELEAATEDLDRIAEALSHGEITEKQAFSRLENLQESLEKSREDLASESPIPKLNGDPKNLNQLQPVAQALKNGDYDEAAQKLKEVMQKMASGEMSEKEIDALKEDMEQLAKMLGGEESMMGEALAEAAKDLKTGDMDAAIAAMEQMNMSMEDLESVLQQMAQLDSMCSGVGECKSLMLGKKGGSGSGKYGNFQGSTFAESNGGLGGPGRGRGNQIGDLPDTESAFDPTMLPGDMTKGKILATIMQRAVPDEDADATIEFSSDAIVAVQQQAEQALTQEEIPPGAREFVRQYFGTLEPETAADQDAPQ